MLSSSLQFLQGSQALIEERIQQHCQQRQQPSFISLVRWRDDDLLKTIVTDMKSQSQIIAHSCVNLALLYSAATVKQEATDSILKEIQEHMQIFLNIYL